MAVCGRKADVEPHRLLVGRENFAPRVVTMSAGVCVGGKGHVNIVDEKAKILFSELTATLLALVSTAKVVMDCE